MKNTIKSLLIALAVLAGLTTVLTGCDNSSGPTTTDLSEGSGYRIRVSISDDILPSGGSTVVTAAIFDETGQPATDAEDSVAFAFSDKGGEWSGLSDGKADLKGGVAIATLKWEDPSSGETVDPSRSAWITVACQGAIAKIQVSLVSTSF